MAFLSMNAQPFGNYGLVLEEITPIGMPGVQSFAWGQHNGQWFIIGGRTDGLHRRQPPFAFLAADNNVNAYVVDPVTGQVWSTAIARSMPLPSEAAYVFPTPRHARYLTRSEMTARAHGLRDAGARNQHFRIVRCRSGPSTRKTGRASAGCLLPPDLVRCATDLDQRQHGSPGQDRVQPI